MRVSEGQKEKIKKAFETNSKYITIRFGVTDLYGEDVIARKGLKIRMSTMQLAHNAKIEVGFLAALAGLIPFLTGTVLPALGVEAISGLASSGVQKLIGSGLYLKKGSGMYRIETDGKGLYPGLASGKGFENVGNGLYLMKQDGLYDGSGLILGPNSHFKNIPFLV